MTRVFINGCFDVLHRGHLELFQYAREIGAEVVVALDNDDKVRRDKGPSRPINKLCDRKFFISKLIDVDKVVDFATKHDLERLIEEMAPDILIVGSDWREKEVVGAQYAKEVRFFERIDGYSTTKIIQDISSR
jgi:D-beta-D-heptose 7-phosphate kinase/D-beta-D-heptose 1-phosphate adenosyltransferase